MLYAAFVVWRAPVWTVDDAYIVARYAENLVRHGALAFNAPPDTGAAMGSARVEGFTSPLSVAVAAAAVALGHSPMLVLKALGCVAFVGAAPCIFLLARELRAPAAGGLVALVNATYAEHATHAVSGLETEVFVMAALLTLWAFAVALRASDAPVLPLAVLGSVVTWTRPEGIAAATILLGIVLVSRRHERPSLRSGLRAAALGLFGPTMALVVGRYAYYGALVPNTFLAKGKEWNAAHLRALASLVDDYILDGVVVAFVVAVAAKLWSGRVTGLSLQKRALLLAPVLVVAMHAIAYGRSEPLMDYGRRFAFHSLPFLLAVLVVAISSALANAPTRATKAAVGVVILVTVTRSPVLAEREANYTTGYARATRDLYEPTAAWIGAHAAKTATLAVYPDAGIIPYRTGLPTIDFGRLNDATLARSRDPGAVARYFFDHMPDFLVVQQPREGRLYEPAAEALVADRRFAESYELSASFAGRNGAALLVYAKRP